MKWGAKSRSTPVLSSSRTWLIGRVSPVSWFSNFKQKGEPGGADKKQQERGKLDFPIPSSSSAARRQAIFCSIVDENDNAYWNLSFRKVKHEAISRISPLSYDSYDEFQVTDSSFKNAEPITRHYDGEGKSRKQEKRLEQIDEEFSSSDEEDCKFSDMDGEGSDAAVKTEFCVNSANIISRGSRSRKTKQNRTKAYATRTDCRVRVLEDMKKGRKKLKKKGTNKQEMEFNSFAVVKSSFNPQQDFKESMVEMIRYKGIKRPEELEELLACYLTMNYDGYHDLIIKVFQKVWFELSVSVH